MERVKILFLLIFFVSGLNATKIDGALEDSLIVQALLSEDDANYPRSQEIFLELYKNTGKLEYLIQASKEAMMYSGGEIEVIGKLKEYLQKQNNLKNLTPARMLIALYVKMGDLKQAEKYANLYLSKSDDIDDITLLATIKSEVGEYKEALRYFKKAYKVKRDDKILMEMVSILEKKLHKEKRAIKLLRKHIRKNPDASVAIYFKLIELYAKRKNFKQILKIYKDLYKRDPQKYFFKKIVSLSLYTNDTKGLIKFLEQNKGDEGLLYMLYKDENRFDKAIKLAQKRFQETKDPKWLAEKAILIYESAYQKRNITPKTLRTFQKLFEKALKMGVKEPLYLNYYGYILIDHDLNIEKGIKLVKEALKVKPHNSYYLDSLAWGLYKLGKCKEAYKIMKKVIAEEGVLKENEMKTHWESIRECNERIDNSSDMF